jgi:hypothetical protein
VEEKAEELYSLWLFRNYIETSDDKHIEIQAPHNSGSLFNYKNIL